MLNHNVDRMNIGDMVIWTSSRGHAYFVDPKQYGILLKKFEQYERWIFCDVLDEQGKINKAMLYKKDNPL